jgi:hypothetical protein
MLWYEKEKALPKGQVSAPNVTHLVPDHLQLEEADRARFWQNVFVSTGFEPRNTEPLRGISGLSHPVLALGIDDQHKRLVAISPEPDARQAAMMQSDVQSTLSNDFNFIVIRPATLDLRSLAINILKKFGKTEIDLLSFFEEINNHKDDINKSDVYKILLEFARPVILAHYTSPMSAMSQFIEILKSLSHFDWISSDTENQNPQFGISSLLSADPTEVDLKVGICPFPFFNMKEDDLNTLINGKNEEIVEKLKEKGVFQYFFPPKDHALLALSDRTLLNPRTIEEKLSSFNTFGHPLSKSEFATEGQSTIDIIDELQDRGLILQGEIEISTTEKGKEYRQSVKFQPRESVFSKIINRISVKDIIEIIK